MAEVWSSRAGFILATIGAAVGLGNIWRFSSVVGQNGGGAYLIPYAVSFFLVALPLVVLELSIGQTIRSNVVESFRTVGERFTAVGWLVVLIMGLILSYYLVITGWTLGFLGIKLLGLEMGFGAFTSSWLPVGTFLVTAVLTGAIVSLGVKDGIERMTTVLVPLVFLILIGLFLHATRLPGFGEGISFLFSPDFSVLRDPVIWSAALGQAFFSLSAGQGIMMTYGSYLDDSTDLISSTAIIGVMDFAAAILAGLIIFPIVFTAGGEPAAGVELAFTTLPAAFEALPFGGIIGAAFFGVLFFAALTSSVSMMEVVVSSLRENTSMTRKKASIRTTGAAIGIGMLSALSYSAMDLTVGGVRILDLLDETAGTFGLLGTSLAIAVVFTWYTDMDRFLETITGPARHLIHVSTRYVLPVLMVALLGVKLLSVAVPGLGVLQHPVAATVLEQSLHLIPVIIVLAVAEYVIERTR
jgi:NSS family neurotransmitter:Na+ symporter